MSSSFKESGIKSSSLALVVSIVFACLAIIPNLSAAQNAPVRPDTKKPITYTVDEDGKISALPAGFALKDGSKYNFEITVAAPKKQYDNLIKYLKGKVKTTLDKLNDPGQTNGTSYLYLLGSQSELDEFKKELNDLYAVFSDANPGTKFTTISAGDDFKYFLGVQFWKDNLFGKIFNAKSNVSATPFSGDLSVNAVIKGEATVTTDDFTAKIWVADLQKQFIAAYFKESRTQISAMLDAIKVKEFYSKTVDKEIPALAKQFAADSGKLTDLNKAKVHVICDPKLYADVQDFKTRAHNNTFINLLKTKWVANWVWYNEGDLKMNPFDFTDDNLLNLKTGSNDSLARYYDAYVKNAADLMGSSTNLNGQKISVKSYDSLNRQRGNGKVVYSYDAQNAAATKTNDASATTFATYNTEENALTFRVLDGSVLSDYFLKSYDASAKLKGLKSNKVEAVANQTTVETNAYNLKSGQDFTVAETVTDVPDQSTVIKDINDFATLGSTAAGQAQQAQPILANILPQLNKFQPITPAVTLTATTIDAVSALKIQNSVRAWQPPSQQAQRYYIRVYFDGTDLKVLTVDKHTNKITAYNITDDIKKTLKDKNLEGCTLLLTNILAEVKKNVAGIDLSYDTEAEFNAMVKSKIDEIQGKVLFAIKDQIKALDVNTAFGEINAYSNLLKIAQLLQVSGAYILPPKQIAVKDGDDPAYFNKLVKVSDQTTSKKMSLKLTVTDTKAKKDLSTKTDVFTTSPGHWLTASLGVTYIFNEFTRNSATVTNGVITNTPDQAQVRLIGGIHFHLQPIILTDNSFMGFSSGHVLSRISIFGGVSFPHALDNLHAGLSLEPWPGVDLTGGVHYYRFTNYSIVDDQIINQHSYYVYNKFFVSLTIEPVTFVKLIGLFK